MDASVVTRQSRLIAIIFSITVTDVNSIFKFFKSALELHDIVESTSNSLLGNLICSNKGYDTTLGLKMII